MPELLTGSVAPHRRGFLKTLGGGILVLLTSDRDSFAQESGRTQHRPSHEDLPQNIAAWLHIAPDGSITAFTGKAEVGQNIRTSLTQAVADELQCLPASVRLVMADTALTPWDMGTFGSRTTPTMAPQLRKMAASAREMLVSAAAQKWNMDRARLAVANACVTDQSNGKTASFRELAARVDWVKSVGRDDLTTPAAKWQVAGTSLSKVSARDIVTGKHKYTSDLKRPGMLYGRILRAPSFGAKLMSLEVGAAQKMPGVTVIHEADFVGVTAPNEHIAQKAIESIKATWKEEPQISAAELFSYLKQIPSESPSETRERHASVQGSVENGIRSAAKTLKSTYTVAYIAHTPLEPRAAVAEWNGSDLTVWTGSQRPFGVRTELADALGTSEERVRVIVPDTGGAYGGKHSGECAIEAAKLAKAANKAVQLVWTREEEFTWAYFRRAGVIEISSGATKDGLMSVWEFHNYNSGPSGIETPYEVANQSIHFHPVNSPLHQGSYRGLAATANHFARESHMDELATALNIDPLAFRLKNLKNPRMRAVLEAAAKRFGWAKNKSASGRGFGLACGTEKGSYFACCAQVSVGDREVHIERVVEAFECGAIVNPEHLKSQVEGAVVMGIGGALHESIDFANGRILNPRLSKYRVPRFSDTPKIDIVLVDRKDLPSAGAGETPIMGIAPAVANAIYNATRLRVRSMPMAPALVKA
ncbi:MAG: molybdopterin cofactor-binding domain-containing protein [Bryobacteraceae bacterium]